jgi:uncharacterized paraquat-inducible protein A
MSIKKCPSCDEELQDSAAFCRNCGAEMAAVAAAPVVAKTSGKAVASLILGFFAFMFPVAVVAIILGHMSRAEIHHSGGRLKGRGIGLAGLIMGYVGLAIFLPLTMIYAYSSSTPM